MDRFGGRREHGAGAEVGLRHPERRWNWNIEQQFVCHVVGAYFPSGVYNMESRQPALSWGHRQTLGSAATELSGGYIVKKAIVTISIVFGAGLLALLGVITYTSIGRALGQHWTSLDGPEPVWPAVVGFGSMWLIAISGVTLVLLLLAALIHGLVQERARLRHVPAPLRPGIDH